jgi:radical SAM superfamily enzyme YgiQ (UPF0313 family)
MLSIAAQTLRAGIPTKLLNLSAFPWPMVERTVRAVQADIFGLSCFTANRRGVAHVAACIRACHPHAHIVVGGPHVTAMPLEVLERWPHVDTVVLGEGEETLRELVARLQATQSACDLPGAAYRVDGRPTLGPPRARLRDLDVLASPHAHFDTHLLMTSRGCPGRCTFCAKNTVWGQAYRTHSVEYVLDSLEAAVARLPLKMLMVKDDTFTANCKRALQVCEGMRRRQLRVLWSCDTRADALNADVLRAMRLAGCERLSLGVESGAPVVLRNIRKNVTPDDVLRVTRLAKQVGLRVRFYMMLGNRGETEETFRESLALVQRAQPHQVIFACLSIYPGTDDFQVLEREGALTRGLYFDADFQELKEPFDASERDTHLMAAWFDANRGIRVIHRESSGELRGVLSRLGDHHAAHLNLGAAYYDEGDLERAESHVRTAVKLGYPAPGLALNYLACIALARNDMAAVELSLREALALDPHHQALQHNREQFRRWREEGSPANRVPTLIATSDFQIFERLVQPMLPGPLADGFERWTER